MQAAGESDNQKCKLEPTLVEFAELDKVTSTPTPFVKLEFENLGCPKQCQLSEMSRLVSDRHLPGVCRRWQVARPRPGEHGQHGGG